MKNKSWSRLLFGGVVTAALIFTVAAAGLTGMKAAAAKKKQNTSQTTGEAEEMSTSAQPAQGSSEEDDAKNSTATKKVESNGYVVVIDAGHQKEGDSTKEPIGPGASETKARVTSGAYGDTSHLNEYELNLKVAKKLQKELEKRGYEVIMCRTENDVNISNSERAKIANDANADAFIRIHADDGDDSSLQGIMTICQTPDNPYNGDLYEKSYLLSECVLEETVAATGAQKRYVWETDSMSGINWATVPVTILEMGFMSNPEEDALMATSAYQKKMAEGVANGIDRYIKER